MVYRRMCTFADRNLYTEYDMKQWLVLLLLLCVGGPSVARDLFPDGTPIPDWFRQTDPVDLKSLGTSYCLTDYGVVADSPVLQTEQIQALIDRVAQAGGGVIVVPKGTFRSGALFFKKGTHLYLEEGAMLQGSDRITAFPIVKTRMEGQTLDYFAALVNADGADGFTIGGKGTLDGNGLPYWESFWLRRKVNPACTNLEELRPRLVYVSNSQDVRIDGITIQNSPFWSTHFYRCSRLKLTNLRITSPAAPVKAPSTDAIDLDVCNNVLVKNCYMAVNDDAVVLKGGKGPYADEDPDNGENHDILVEDCTYGFCHSAFTCGSECLHSRNVIVRRCKVEGTAALLTLKMRPDTPQLYEYLLIEDITGSVSRVLNIAPWKQFFDLKGRQDIPKSYARQVTLQRMRLDCDIFFNVTKSEQYELSDFTFRQLEIQATKSAEIDKSIIQNAVYDE